jgi:hypothetical protein
VSRYSYVVTLRLFNGEPEGDWVDAAAQLVHLSAVLESAAVHADVRVALISLQQRAIEVYASYTGTRLNRKH